MTVYIYIYHCKAIRSVVLTLYQFQAFSASIGSFFTIAKHSSIKLINVLESLIKLCIIKLKVCSRTPSCLMMHTSGRKLKSSS